MIARSIVLAYHGCDYSLAAAILNKTEYPAIGIHTSLKLSHNDYDWLGEGIYFWENSPLRAFNWANFLMSRPRSSIKQPAVIGAIIDLGHCLDLTDQSSLRLLQETYSKFVETYHTAGLPIPKNKGVGEDDHDLILRYLDCAVINYYHKSVHEENQRRREDPKNIQDPIKEFDSVRGVFYEGKSLFDGSKFREKTHIQIAVRNTGKILGYFWPKSLTE